LALPLPHQGSAYLHITALGGYLGVVEARTCQGGAWLHSQVFLKHNDTSTVALCYQHRIRCPMLQRLQVHTRIRRALLPSLIYPARAGKPSVLLPVVLPLIKKKHIRTLVRIGRLKKHLAITLSVETPTLKINSCPLP